MRQDPEHTWNIRTPADLLSKARRDLSLLEKANEQNDPSQVDHALNCAVTAWHVTDWIWRKHEDRWRKEGLNCIGDLRKRLYEHEGGKCLRYCADLTNGMKHMEVTRPKDRVSTHFSDTHVPDGKLARGEGIRNLIRLPVFNNLGDRTSSLQIYEAEDKNAPLLTTLTIKTSEGRRSIYEVLTASIKSLEDFLKANELC